MKSKYIICIICILVGVLNLYVSSDLKGNAQSLFTAIGVILLLPSLVILSVDGSWDFADWQEEGKSQE